MMAWYARAIRLFPEGLVSQAQAAAMLGVSRTAVRRLVGGRHLRAVYFPRPPDIAGLGVGADDPAWREVAGWLGIDPDDPRADEMPKACYVSFADVLGLWRRGRARGHCTRDWESILAVRGVAPTPPAEPVERPASEPRETSGEIDSWML